MMVLEYSAGFKGVGMQAAAFISNMEAAVKLFLSQL